MTDKEEEFDDEKPISEEDVDAPKVEIKEKKKKTTPQDFMDKTAELMDDDIKLREKTIAMQNEMLLNERIPCYPLSEELRNTEVFVKKIDISKISSEWTNLGHVSNFRLLDDNSILLFKFKEKIKEKINYNETPERVRDVGLRNMIEREKRDRGKSKKRKKRSQLKW